MNPLRAARQVKSGNQPRDPAKAAEAVLTLVGSANAPTRLLLDEDALALVSHKLEAMRSKIEAWQGL